MASKIHLAIPVLNSRLPNKDAIASDNAFASKARQKQVKEVNFNPNSTN